MKEITEKLKGRLNRETIGAAIFLALFFLMNRCQNSDSSSAMEVALSWQSGYPVHRDDVAKVQNYVYFYGNFREKSVNAKMYKQVSVAAKNGDAESQLQLCTMHVLGAGVSKDYSKAFKLCQASADGGNASAQNKLGLMHALAMGVKRDYGENYKQATYWFQKAADHGDTYGRVNLCEMRRIKTSSWDACQEESSSSYSRAAEQGNALAQYKMGEILRREGRLEESAMWLKKVARKGSPLAQINLAYVYMKLGKEEEVVPWLLMAAKRGNAQAQRVLGVEYYKGNIIQQDMVEAYVWLSLSKYVSWNPITTSQNSANRRWSTAFANVCEKLTDEQLKQAEQRLNRWRPIPSEEERRGVNGISK